MVQATNTTCSTCALSLVVVVSKFEPSSSLFVTGVEEEEEKGEESSSLLQLFILLQHDDDGAKLDAEAVAVEASMPLSDAVDRQTKDLRASSTLSNLLPA